MKSCLSLYFLNFMVLSVMMLSGLTNLFAEPYQTIINNGSPQNRVDIAILGDGYTNAQLAQYQADVQQFIQGVFAQEPYREYQRYYNVHRVDVISAQSGADHPERNPPFFVNTALDATYNCSNIQRLICVNLSKVNQVIGASLPANHYDVVLVIVNDVEYGGSGGSIAVASKHPSAVELILHEVGHSFGLLADEYSGGGFSCNPNFEPYQVNSTRETQRALIKWNMWIDAATPIPTTTTTAGIPGLYEGSVYCDFGLYRPTSNSKMRSLGPPFEQINTEQHVKRIYNFVAPIDSSSPAEPTVTMTTSQTQEFSIDTPLPFTHDLDINWSVDGQTVAAGATFQLSGSTLSVGPHTIQGNVFDPTPFVRNASGNELRQIRSWVVNVEVEPTTNTRFDFDGDSKTDPSIFRPSVGQWWYLRSTDFGNRAFNFGTPSDKLVPADYTGDGRTDIAFWRPSTGEWFILRSEDNSFYSVPFGLSTDIPAPGDFDGDGKADTAVFRPSSATWFIQRSSDNGTTIQGFGIPEDKPTVEDFDGDGMDDIAIFRPSVSQWWQLRTTSGVVAYQFGMAGDRTVPGDYTGDGKADVAFWRPATGEWFVLRSEDNSFYSVPFGIATDLPTAGDYDGDGKTDTAVFRPSDNNWYVQGSTSGFFQIGFGQTGDSPVPNAFVVP